MKYVRKVTLIIDGDTFKVDKSIQGTFYIRIAKMNAPEKGQRGYTEAKLKLKKKLLNKQVKIEPLAWSYSRLVCNVWII